MDSSSHGAVGTVDLVAYALGVDALSNPGPADPARISPSVCSQTFMPGVNPSTVGADSSAAQAEVARSFATFPHVSSEPALRCYVTGTCAVAKPKCKAKKKHHKKHRAAVSKKKKHQRGCKKKKKRKKHGR